MNSKLKFVSICSLLMIPMIGYAANLACPTAQEIMKSSGSCDWQSQFANGIWNFLTGTIITDVNSYVFTGAAIPLEKAPGQTVYCNYLSTQVHPAPVPLMANTSSVFSPVIWNMANFWKLFYMQSE